MRYKPFGETRYAERWGGTPTDRRFTGQREETGLGSLYDYGARFYSPVLGRFISADSIVPGAASGSGGGAATLGYDSSSRLTTLTTDFHEFIGKVTQENQAVLQYGPFFQWSEKVRKDNPVPSGPLNPQALNRYSYVLNNPLRYVDPTGHEMIRVSKETLEKLYEAFTQAQQTLEDEAAHLASVSAGLWVVAAGAEGLAWAQPETQPAAQPTAIVSAILAAATGLGSTERANFARDLGKIASVLKEAIGNADQTAHPSAFLTINSTGFLMSTMTVSCVGCTKPANILDSSLTGRSPAAWVMWGLFRSAHNGELGYIEH